MRQSRVSLGDGTSRDAHAQKASHYHSVKPTPRRSGSQWEQNADRLWETCRMKKPRLRVTKWLRDIPVEIECTACPEWKFRATSMSHRPNREEYTQQLQRAFDEHFGAVHNRQDSGPITS